MLTKGLKAKYNIQVIKIQCGNAGENCVLEEWCKREGNLLVSEYTASHKPQQNGHVEQKVAMLFSWARSMLNGGSFINSLGQILLADAANTETLLENCIANAGDEKSAFQ